MIERQIYIIFYVKGEGIMVFNTEQDYIQALDMIIEPLREKLKKYGCAVRVGSTGAWYGERAEIMETFARPLWGLVPLWYKGGGDDELKKIYLNGLIEGTDPESDGYWGVCGECDQRYVEMAAVAYALLYVPEIVWEPMNSSQRSNFKRWLWQINDHRVCDSNWRFFRVLVNIALKHVGEEYSQERLDEDLSRIDEFYLGGGWYMDGPQHQKDYYISMAIHFYSLIYSCFENDSYAEKYRSRAALFANDFIYWFADNGAALPYGRSLTYRFAQGAFWSAYLMAGVSGMDKAVIKGILSRHLSDWLSAPIFDNGGVLTIGYKYPDLLMAEHYNAPGSPYWALKTFAVLAVASDDDFWSAECAPMPNLEKSRLMREADILINRCDGEVFAYPGGTHDNLGCGQLAAKYLKFVYSTRFGFNVKYSSLSADEAAGDNMLIFDIGGVLCERRYNFSFSLSEDKLVINWSPIRGIRVRTELLPDGGSHVRTHYIESEFECIAYDGGFAVPDGDADFCEKTADGACASALGRSGGCTVLSHSGGKGMIVNASPNTNVIRPRTVIPTVRYRIPRGSSMLITEVKNCI